MDCIKRIVQERLFAICYVLLSFVLRCIKLIKYTNNRIFEFLGGCLKDILMLLDIIIKLCYVEHKKEATDIELLKEIQKEYDDKSNIILKVQSRKRADEENVALLSVKDSYNKYINNIQNIN